MEGPQIPVFDVRLDDEDVEAVVEVLRSGWLTMGPRTAEFEGRFAEYLGCEHVVATSSCTAALHLALLCAGVGPGDEVIVPAITFVATANAVRYCGATPVFAEIVGDGDLGIDVADVETRITDRTRAVLPVHFAGYPAAIEPLADLCRRRDLALVEDAAQSPGSRVEGGSVGTFGLAGCFSFFSNKPLGVGEGGAIATDSAEVAAQARSLRSHGMTAGTWDRHRGHAETYDVVGLGFNYRIDEQRAALLSVRLGRLDDSIRRRNELIARYRSELASVDGLEVAYAEADPATSSGYLMLVLLDEPDRRPELRTRLREEHGVQTTVFPAVHRFTAFGGEESAPLARTEAAAQAHLVLPLFPHMSTEQQDTVVAALREELG